MPGGDRTGPRGMGAQTGRGAGFCGGYANPGWANPMPGGGLGRGFGGGWGGGFGFGGGRAGRGRFRRPGWGGAWYGPGLAAQPAVPDLERKNLAAQVEFLEAELARLRRRLETLGETGPAE